MQRAAPIGGDDFLAAEAIKATGPEVLAHEVALVTDLIRRYARSLRGTRIGEHAPCGHWQTHAVIAALRPTDLTATTVFDGPMDTATPRKARPTCDSAASPGPR